MLGRLQTLALQTLTSCDENLIYAASFKLLEPDLNSWHDRKCMPRICSIAIDWVDVNHRA